ncbi:MAG: 50S ribosomal protein L3 [Gemmatimonadales bacterium]|nr:50S ribosomal protein L3 [Gemmatimonadales bacterium]
MNGLIGRKLGMTRIYGDDGNVIPCTVIEAGPCPVLQVTAAKGTPTRVQLGFGARKAKRTTKALAGHAAKVGLEATPSVLRNFRLPDPADESPKPGDVVTVAIFEAGEKVKVTGTTRGRGFQGVVKRHGFRGGPATHGNTRHRKPGSLGPGTDPSRVIKGKKMPGQYGNVQDTVMGLAVVRVDPERNLLFLRGAVPGPRRGIVVVRKQGGRSRYA